MADTAGLIDTTARAGPSHAAPSRWAGAVGVGFVVLFVAGALMDNTPQTNASDAKWISYYASSGNRATLLVAGFLLVLAALCLLAFFSVLWNRVAAAREGRRTNPLPVVAAAAGGAGIAIGAFLSASIAGGMVFGNLPEPAPAIMRLVEQLGFPLLMVAGMFAVALAIAAVSLQAKAAGAFGTGMTVFSLIMAVITLGSFYFIPLLAPLLWVLVTSIILIRRPALARREPSGTPATPSSPDGPAVPAYH